MDTPKLQPISNKKPRKIADAANSPGAVNQQTTPTTSYERYVSQTNRQSCARNYKASRFYFERNERLGDTDDEIDHINRSYRSRRYQYYNHRDQNRHNNYHNHNNNYNNNYSGSSRNSLDGNYSHYYNQPNHYYTENREDNYGSYASNFYGQFNNHEFYPPNTYEQGSAEATATVTNNAAANETNAVITATARPVDAALQEKKDKTNKKRLKTKVSKSTTKSKEKVLKPATNQTERVPLPTITVVPIEKLLEINAGTATNANQESSAATTYTESDLGNQLNNIHTDVSQRPANSAEITRATDNITELGNQSNNIAIDAPSRLASSTEIVAANKENNVEVEPTTVSSRNLTNIAADTMKDNNFNSENRQNNAQVDILQLRTNSLLTRLKEAERVKFVLGRKSPKYLHIRKSVEREQQQQQQEETREQEATQQLQAIRQELQLPSTAQQLQTPSANAVTHDTSSKSPIIATAHVIMPRKSQETATTHVTMPRISPETPTTHVTTSKKKYRSNKSAKSADSSSASSSSDSSSDEVEHSDYKHVNLQNTQRQLKSLLLYFEQNMLKTLATKLQNSYEHMTNGQKANFILRICSSSNYKKYLQNTNTNMLKEQFSSQRTSHLGYAYLKKILKRIVNKQNESSDNSLNPAEEQSTQVRTADSSLTATMPRNSQQLDWTRAYKVCNNTNQIDKTNPPLRNFSSTAGPPKTQELQQPPLRSPSASVSQQATPNNKSAVNDLQQIELELYSLHQQNSYITRVINNLQIDQMNINQKLRQLEQNRFNIMISMKPSYNSVVASATTAAAECEVDSHSSPPSTSSFSQSQHQQQLVSTSQKRQKNSKNTTNKRRKNMDSPTIDSSSSNSSPALSRSHD